MESSRTHFEVLGLNLEAPSPRKLACPRLEDSTICWIVKILWSAWKIFWKTFFCGDRLKNFCEHLFFFWRALALVSLVLGLGLEHSCPWPQECLSSERLSLALASDFFGVLGLGLEPCVLDSTSVEFFKVLELTRSGIVPDRLPFGSSSSVRKIFERRGPENLRILRIMKTRKKIFQPKTSPTQNQAQWPLLPPKYAPG